jgi:predicted alpha/beta-fold hydrolase
MARFKPAQFLENGHLQTLYPALFNKPPLPDIELEIFEFEDGDFVECLWSLKHLLKDKNRPIVVLFHGLAGSFKSPYILRVIKKLSSNGYSVVLMHFRGCGINKNRLPRSYHSGESEDAKILFESIRKKYPTNPLHAIGYSLGGNMLLKLLGEYKANSPLSSAIAISAPMQLESSANRMNRGFSKLYQYRLLYELKKQLKQKYIDHDMEKFLDLKKENIDKINSFWEFDDLYTAPIHGFKNAKDYYQKSSSKQYLKYIKTDTLIIHAKDDPFMGKDVIPTNNELSKDITFELYPHGGHVGFVSGTIFKPIYWLEERIIEFFTNR